MDLRRVVSSLAIARKKYVRGKGNPDKETNVFYPSFLEHLMKLDWTNNKKYVEVWLKWIYKRHLGEDKWHILGPLPDPWWKEGTVSFSHALGRFLLTFPNGKSALGFFDGTRIEFPGDFTDEDGKKLADYLSSVLNRNFRWQKTVTPQEMKYFYDPMLGAIFAYIFKETEIIIKSGKFNK